jgi:hypothetical protein
MAATFRRFLHIVVGILREIGDENAYSRHLLSHRRQHSGREWRTFCEERLRAKYQRPKCC